MKVSSKHCQKEAFLVNTWDVISDVGSYILEMKRGEEAVVVALKTKSQIRERMEKEANIREA